MNKYTIAMLMSVVYLGMLGVSGAAPKNTGTPTIVPVVQSTGCIVEVGAGTCIATLSASDPANFPEGTNTLVVESITFTIDANVPVYTSISFRAYYREKTFIIPLDGADMVPNGDGSRHTRSHTTSIKIYHNGIGDDGDLSLMSVRVLAPNDGTAVVGGVFVSGFYTSF